MNELHCTEGHYHHGPAGTSLGWHGDQVMPLAMQRNVADAYLHTRILVGSMCSSGQEFEIFRLLPPALSLTHAHFCQLYDIHTSDAFFIIVVSCISQVFFCRPMMSKHVRESLAEMFFLFFLLCL